MDKEFESIVRNVGNYLINKYNNNKCILCGINGPYDDNETRVRNLCHLIIITSIEYLLTSKKEIKDILKTMADDLVSEQKEESAYVLRVKKGKDGCNGVIGHAWVIEAYIYLYKAFKNNLYLDKCNELSNLHVFDYDSCLWYIPKTNNNTSNIDYTYNHQLWYAASLMELNKYLKNNRIENELTSFFRNLPKISSNSLKGKISHSIYFRKGLVSNYKQKIKRVLDLCKERINVSSMKYKEEGYHLFNLMAFSRIYFVDSSLKIFNTSFFNKALKYLNSDNYLLGLEDPNFNLDHSLNNANIKNEEKKINVYGYSYNVPGFEIDYINIAFEGRISSEILNKIKENQIKYTYNSKKMIFGLNCHDQNTINYRVYEFYRYLEKKNEKNL